MRLSNRKKFYLFQLIALGYNPARIKKEIDEKFGQGRTLSPSQIDYYSKKFRELDPEEQISYLPYNMQTSFALQEVRINDDIKDLIRLDKAIEDGEGDLVDLVRAKATIKNRIAQELGQALAYSKGGIRNINILQMVQNKFEGILSQAHSLSEEERLDLFKRLKVVEENVTSQTTTSS